MTGQTDPIDHPFPMSWSNHAFNRNCNPSSSWLSGHLGLIQQNASSQLAVSNPPSLVKMASLKKLPSFNKIPCCPQLDPLPNQEQEATALALKPLDHSHQLYRPNPSSSNEQNPKSLHRDSRNWWLCMMIVLPSRVCQTLIASME
eukprot:CCRYP_017853-RA/>CCRYP_017853-RA protein AED:0.13 eAED:0.13 QI:0/-1/0/1/-1/1/1/0/144